MLARLTIGQHYAFTVVDQATATPPYPLWAWGIHHSGGGSGSTVFSPWSGIVKDFGTLRLYDGIF